MVQQLEKEHTLSTEEIKELAHYFGSLYEPDKR